MSPEIDRIEVPTNGKGPTHADERAPAAADTPEIADAPEPADTSLAFTPTQLAVGFGILASLILLLAGRMRRRRRSRPGGPFGRR